MFEVREDDGGGFAEPAGHDDGDFSAAFVCAGKSFEFRPENAADG